MRFTLLGKTIEIPEGRKNFIKIASDFNSMIAEACRILNADIANMLAEKDRGLNNLLDDYVTETRNYLSKYGIFTISEREIWSYITSNNNGESCLQYSFEKMFSDIAKEAFDFDDIDDRTNYIVKKSISLMNSGYLNGAIRADITALRNFVMKYLTDNEIIDIDMVTQESFEKSEAIYSNLVAGNVPSADCETVATSLIELDCSEEKYYTYIFNTFPKAKYEISAIAQYLEIDLSELIEKDIKRSFNLKNIDCEEDALMIMADLQETMNKFGITTCARENELKKILRDFDVKARTYDDVLYDTRELRAKAEKDDIELSELHGNVNNLDKITCGNLLAEIAHMDCIAEIKTKHLKLLNNQMDYIDNEHLKQLIENIDTYSENECNQIKDEISRYDASQEIKKPFLSQIDNRIYDIWDVEDFERFKEIYINTQLGNFEQITKNRDLINETGRTKTKELFLNALQLFTENEIQEAAKYAVAKEGNLFSQLINMGKKASYNILTLNEKIMHPALAGAIDTVKDQKSGGILSSLRFKKNKTISNVSQTSGTTANGHKFCSACGTKLDVNAKFCTNCGNKLS